MRLGCNQIIVLLIFGNTVFDSSSLMLSQLVLKISIHNNFPLQYEVYILSLIRNSQQKCVNAYVVKLILSLLISIAEAESLRLSPYEFLCILHIFALASLLFSAYLSLRINHHWVISIACIFVRPFRSCLSSDVHSKNAMFFLSFYCIYCCIFLIYVLLNICMLVLLSLCEAFDGVTKSFNSKFITVILLSIVTLTFCITYCRVGDLVNPLNGMYWMFV